MPYKLRAKAITFRFNHVFIVFFGNHAFYNELDLITNGTSSRSFGT